MPALNFPLVSDYNLSDSLKPVAVLEASAGATRSRLIEERLQECARFGARTFNLSCDFEQGGPWAGVTALFSELLGEIQQRRDAANQSERNDAEDQEHLPRVLEGGVE